MNTPHVHSRDEKQNRRVSGKTIPPDSFLHGLERFGLRGNRRVWRELSGRDVRYYTWDSLHIESKRSTRAGNTSEASIL